MAQFIPRWLGEVEGEKLTFYEKESFRQYLQGIQGKVEILVYPWAKRRTNKQNDFYWGYLRMIQDETGETVEALHELFKKKFLDTRKIEVLGEQLDVYPSTTRLTRKEMAGYITEIETFTGIQAPDSKQVAII